MKILALNPYHGGSHRAFLDGWLSHSRHQFDVWTLPAYKWKWRMRHAAVTFAERLADTEACWDCCFCTDMLNVAEFRGLLPARFRSLPVILYFHENQLTYPTRNYDPRDLHFAFTNFTSALAADAVWFNSAFHQNVFLKSLAEWLVTMPDYQPIRAVESLNAKVAVHSPGVATQVPQAQDVQRPCPPGPLRIVWVARWEHDKGPELFVAALRQLRLRDVDFRLRVCGQSFAELPAAFVQCRTEFEDRIEHWGYVDDRSQYFELLATSDVVVSTSEHEFFGIAVLEAVRCGCWPLVPRSLAYPEVLSHDDRFFHQHTADNIANRLAEMAERIAADGTLPPLPDSLRSELARFEWPRVAQGLDRAMDNIRRP